MTDPSNGRQRGRVSALIPTYDRVRELHRAVRSVLGQGDQLFELLVGDDGGAGRMLDVQDPRLVITANVPPASMAANWNALLDRAQGDYVALLMDDDVWHQGFLSACTSVLDADPSVGVVFTNHDVVEVNGARHTRIMPLAAGKYNDFSLRFLELSPVAVSAAVFRRSLWPLVAPLPSTGAADMVLFGRLAAIGTAFYYLGESLMSYASHDAQYSSSLRFRHEAPLAWTSLSFADPAAEALRRGRLAQARLSSAKGYLQEARPEAAMAELPEPTELTFAQRRDRLLIMVLARMPAVVPTVMRGVRSLRTLRAAFARSRPDASPAASSGSP